MRFNDSSSTIGIDETLNSAESQRPMPADLLESLRQLHFQKRAAQIQHHESYDKTRVFGTGIFPLNLNTESKKKTSSNTALFESPSLASIRTNIGENIRRLQQRSYQTSPGVSDTSLFNIADKSDQQISVASPRSSPNPPHHELVKERRGENRIKLDAHSRVNSFRKTIEKKVETEVELVPAKKSFDLATKGPSALMFSLHDTDMKTKQLAKIS